MSIDGAIIRRLGFRMLKPTDNPVLTDKYCMEDITEAYMSEMHDSAYVRPFRFHYTQGGKHKTWDLLEVHDSVAVIVFNVTRRVMVFVKQFRPAVYYNSIAAEDRKGDTVDLARYPPSNGITLELCAGIVDKDLPLEKIAAEEVLEECGYKIDVKSLEKVMCYRSGVGVQGSQQTLYYCEVTDDMKTEDGGGGVDDEVIEVVEMSIPEVERLLARAGPAPLPSPPSCLFGLLWFLRHKADANRKSFEQYCGTCKEADEDAALETHPEGIIYHIDEEENAEKV